MPKLVPIETRPEIARRRIALGIQQATFARMIGVAPVYYVHIDRGDRPYPPHLAERANIILTELEAATYRAQSRVQQLVGSGAPERGAA